MTKAQLKTVLESLLARCFSVGINTLGEFIEYNNANSIEKIERI